MCYDGDDGDGCDLGDCFSFIHLHHYYVYDGKENLENVHVVDISSVNDDTRIITIWRRYLRWRC